jgi:hypothetical protein
VELEVCYLSGSEALNKKLELFPTSRPERKKKGKKGERGERKIRNSRRTGEGSVRK